MPWRGSSASLPTDPRSYTPKHLAEKILTTRSAIEGERKQVTVLFADVKGSMDLAEQLDPEEWHKVLDGFFQILNEGVHRFDWHRPFFDRVWGKRTLQSSRGPFATSACLT